MGTINTNSIPREKLTSKPSLNCLLPGLFMLRNNKNSLIKSIVSFSIDISLKTMSLLCSTIGNWFMAGILVDNSIYLSHLGLVIRYDKNLITNNSMELDPNVIGSITKNRLKNLTKIIRKNQYPYQYNVDIN
jgi:hypothetical protein